MWTPLSSGQRLLVERAALKATRLLGKRAKLNLGYLIHPYIVAYTVPISLGLSVVLSSVNARQTLICF